MIIIFTISDLQISSHQFGDVESFFQLVELHYIIKSERGGTFMKKIISVIIAAVLTCSFTMLCQASDMYDKQAGLEEIEKLSSEILEFVNNGYRGVYDGEPAGEKDIDFSKAYKTYVDLDIFQKEKLSEEELEKMIQESPVVWTVPVYYDEATCLVEISKGLPLDKENEEGLTEEQKEQIINAEGKWTGRL